MRAWLKRHWVELLVFGLFLGVFVLCAAPDLTWMHVDSDGPEYVMDAKYLYPAHHTSAPLYLLIGHLFLYLPFGTDYWKMSVMSGLFTLGTMIFIYLTVMSLLSENARRRFYALLASAIFGSAALVIAQATIVQTFAVVTMFSVGAYYFAIKRNWVMASVMLGAGLVTHHLILLTWVVLLVAHRELRNWRQIGITASFLIFYLYIPLSVRFTDQPNMWGNTSFTDFFSNNINVFMMLVGQLAIYDFPKRVLDTIGILGISLGLALIPITWYLWKRKQWKMALLWLFALPILYFATNMPPQTAKYMEASIAWGAILAVLGLSRMNFKWSYAVAVGTFVLLLVNANYLDIGRTLDPDLAATKFYKEELPRMNDGDIFVTMGAWEWIEVFLYNKENDREIIPVCIGILASERYQDMLREQGVHVESVMVDVQPHGRADSNQLNLKQVMVALSIVENNDRVWASRSTDPSVYGAELVTAKGNEHLIERWVGDANVVPQWQFKPSNPYDVITGAIEVEEWVFILQSNWSCMFFAQRAAFGVFAYWLLRQLWFSMKSRKREEESEGYT